LSELWKYEIAAIEAYQSKLVQGESFTASRNDASTGSAGESQSSDAQFGKFEKAMQSRLAIRSNRLRSHVEESTYRVSSVTVPTTTTVFFSCLTPLAGAATETIREMDIGGPATWWIS
jgi:hypothetical protein